MAFMMGGGIGFRAAGIFPEVFIAVFYTGLGCALALAGIAFKSDVEKKLSTSVRTYVGLRTDSVQGSVFYLG